MNRNIREKIFSNWNFIRWFRLAMGLIIAYQAFELQNGLMGLLAGLFIFQALANAGCCTSNSCNTALEKQKSGKAEDIKFEEIKGR